MAIPARDIIDEARDYHASFDPETHQDKMLLRVLSRAERDVYQKALELADELVTVPEVITLAQITAALANDAGIAISTNILVSSGECHIVGTLKKMPLTTLAGVHRSDPPYPWRPTAWIEGEDLVLLDLRRFGGDTTGWENVEQITLQIVPAPTQITDVADNVTLPDIARSALVDSLVAFMAKRKSVDAGVTLEDAANSRREVALTLRQQAQVGSWRVRRTY